MVFDPSRIRLADTDSSGIIDLRYKEVQGIRDKSNLQTLRGVQENLAKIV